MPPVTAGVSMHKIEGRQARCTNASHISADIPLPFLRFQPLQIDAHQTVDAIGKARVDAEILEHHAAGFADVGVLLVQGRDFNAEVVQVFFQPAEFFFIVAGVVGGQKKSAGAGFNVIRAAGKRGALRNTKIFPVEGDQCLSRRLRVGIADADRAVQVTDVGMLKFSRVGPRQSYNRIWCLKG